ncbi:MAG: glycosyltransferase [Chthoniobacterales bacterium]
MECTLLEVEDSLRGLSASTIARFEALLDRELTDHPPDIVFTFGALSWEEEWRKKARRHGAAVVFGLRNLAYLRAHPGYFYPSGGVDAVLACSDFVLNRYRAFHGGRWAALPTPLDFDEVLAPEPQERIFVTYINPSVAKGVMFFARLAEELGRRRPDLPMLVIEGRSQSDTLLDAAALGGFDLTRHESLMVSPLVAQPRDIFRVARLVVMPSVWAEPSGRTAAEALVNGIPPIVSDRGGLPETCGAGGFVLPLPTNLTMKSARPVPAENVREWYELIERLCDDDEFYEMACNKARAASVPYRPENLAPRYREFFSSITRC